MAEKPIWQIRLLVESDDAAEVERLAQAVGRVACPEDDPSPQHVCPVPWFVVTSEAEDAEEWREVLNR